MSLSFVPPRVSYLPDTAVGSWGPKVLDFGRAIGVDCDDWQEHVILQLFAVDASNEWVGTEAGLLVSRQNGKGEILVLYDLAHAFLFRRPDNRRKLTLHTAHEMKTAVDGFKRMTGVLESNEKLMARVAPNGIRIGNGQEGITLAKRPGQKLNDQVRFIARSRNSGRGFSADVIVYDEAQELSSSSRDALTYTTSTAPNLQELFTGTAPQPENDSEVFEGVRDRGRRSAVGIEPADATIWLEWSPLGSDNPDAVISHPNAPALPVEGLPFIDLGDPAVWREAIPSLDIRIKSKTVARQVERAVDIAALAVERFSIWPDRRAEVEEIFNELELDKWDAEVGEEWRVLEPTGIAVSCTRNGSFATIAKAARINDFIAVEHHDTRAGTIWVAAAVKSLKERYPDALVVIDERNASSILPDLQQAGVKYMAMNINEVAGAHARFIEDVNGSAVRHPPQDEVRQSLKFASTRRVGSAGFTWQAGELAKPVTHAEAVTWAHWGVRKLEAAPPRKPAIVRGYA